MDLPRSSSKLDKMLNGSKQQPTGVRDELTQYLDSDEKHEEIEIEPISDTEEPDELEKEVMVMVDIGDETAEPQLPENSTQLRASGRKRKQREDDTFEYH
ncbi:hypothetical protein N7494_010291 [Penicillium frequentans]|uniref:Uncharacterized protein n=1 Tax=Penicillium frequentans TaxID=3151616 RepID=A0AAD6CRJ8_9EURO|nr:hypothetical protein N7494_010291 [Penicillium glabrum]